MKDPGAVIRGIVADLQGRRLLPVAIGLVLLLIAVPVLMLDRPGSEPAVPAVAPSANTAAPDGLPSPDQALGTDKPLVSLAVLDQPSNLGEFESKNPFKPIEQVASTGATDDGSSGSTAAPSPGTSNGSPGTGTTGESTGGSGGSDGGGGGGQQPTTSPERQPAPKPDDPGTTPTPKTEEKLTYALDLTIRGPKGLRSYRGLPKLSLLPAQDNPLLVFLGIEDAGTKAVFLVDVKLKSVEGEGRCTPSPAQCATLALAPGEEHVLANDAGQRWTIRIVEVRETTVANAAATARKAQKRRARKSTRTAGEQPAPRFVLPIITDLFTGGRS